MKEEEINFTVLEATRYVGGTWRYDPRVGTDENGLLLHTSMYKHLRSVFIMVGLCLLIHNESKLSGKRLTHDISSQLSLLLCIEHV